MSTPNFRRGTPQSTSAAMPKDNSWLAKYDGSCNYCGTHLTEGESRVKWNEDRTAVVCAFHK